MFLPKCLGNISPNADYFFCSIIQVVSKTAGVMIVKMAPSLTEVFGVSGCFAFFGVCVLISVIVGFMFMPETKGLSLIELENLYRPDAEKIPASAESDECLKNALQLDRDSRKSSIISL